MEERLLPRQLQFCVEYIVDLHGTNAAKRAGYTDSNAVYQATALLKDPRIIKEVTRLQEERIKRTLITADYVLVSLKEVAERCMQRVPVMKYNKVEKKMEQVTAMVAGPDGSMHEEGVWEFDSGGANRALELLGKNLQLFTDQIVHRGDITFVYGHRNTDSSIRPDTRPGAQAEPDTK
jgi:phage terminase small subunit